MIELGLERISRLLSRTHLPWRAIHVAGTNGKGSICVYISGMLEAYNNSDFRKSHNKPILRHGRFTSPHLIDRWDCISINQKTVSPALFHEIEKKVFRRNLTEKINASKFELLTATAFEIFTHENVDIGVIEVGMGGGLDATNILGVPVKTEDPSTDPVTRATPLVTAIAKIGLDHQSFLGTSLEAIAATKAGILKHRVPFVYDSSNPREVIETFKSRARWEGAVMPSIEALVAASPELSQTLAHTLPASNVATLGILDHETTGDVPTHTRHNTSVALQATILALRKLNPDITEDVSRDQSLLLDLLSVPTQTTFPGRLQNLNISSLTGRTSPILLDGAHNAQSAAVLAEAVTRLRSSHESGDAKVTWVLAASDSKNIHELLQPLLRAGDQFCAVEFGPVDGMPWVKAMAAEKVAAAAMDVLREKGDSCNDSDDVNVAFGRDVVGGLRQASKLANEGPMVIAGSLYLVGSVLRALRQSEGAI